MRVGALRPSGWAIRVGGSGGAAVGRKRAIGCLGIWYGWGVVRLWERWFRRVRGVQWSGCGLLWAWGPRGTRGGVPAMQQNVQLVVRKSGAAGRRSCSAWSSGGLYEFLGVVLRAPSTPGAVVLLQVGEGSCRACCSLPGGHRLAAAERLDLAHGVVVECVDRREIRPHG